ncbi:CCA tRNA nucleotidyltransferase [Oscillospiraceae bacterium MB08-C2-2]|nr:CCA tRNA nucleotidyltransferase [Oscillospiraceae bacterium MB08-C2-2]
MDIREPFALPPDVKMVLDTLEAAGFEAFIVGGCVRDRLLGKSPHDWDICTNAQPGEIIACFGKNRIIPTGITHGTVTLIAPEMPLEITTYRVDGRYLDSRHPEQVNFTGLLQEDLARRDFTVNAMAYSPTRGLIDLFGGREDLAHGILRTVGSPKERFEEDALRILRLFRFEAKLDFTPEPETLAGAIICRDGLSHISWERKAAELSAILLSPYPRKGLERMIETGAMEFVLPEWAPCRGFDQRNHHHSLLLDEHILKTVECSPCSLVERLCMLCHDLGKPQSFTTSQDGEGHFYGHAEIGEEITRTALTRLRYPTALVERVARLVGLHSITLEPNPRQLRRLLSKLGEEGVHQLLEVQKADTMAKAPRYIQPRLKVLAAAQRTLEEIIAAKHCISLSDLKVDGNRLMAALGLPPGPEIGKLLQALLAQVLEDPSMNEEQVLLETAKRLKGDD